MTSILLFELMFVTATCIFRNFHRNIT